MSSPKYVDRYAGIATVIAVLLAVEYSQDAYDVWDLSIGVLGFVLALKYREYIDGTDRLLSGLTATLASLSIVICLYSLVGTVIKNQPQWLKDILSYEISLPGNFLLVVVLAVVLGRYWNKRAKMLFEEKSKKGNDDTA